jgi:hypothetical protein
LSKKYNDARIIETEKPYIERERKLVPVVPADVAAKGEFAAAAYKQRKLLLIADHVRLATDVYVTSDHPAIAPAVPAALGDIYFRAPLEEINPREYIYFVDADMKVRKFATEFRQAAHPIHGIKQNIKIGRAVADRRADDITLNRLEMRAKVTGYGPVFAAVEDERERRWLRRHFKEAGLKPAFRLGTQRIRIPYHPEGDTNVKIELACVHTLFGETIFGKVWSDPKLEIEIKKGPEDEAACRRILEREQQRIMDEFDMAPNDKSNAEVGYDRLLPDLQTAQGRRVFERLGPREIWWDRPGRARWGLK